jgi:hypothetical protein
MPAVPAPAPEPPTPKPPTVEPRRPRRAQPEPWLKAAEQARALGRLVGPHSTRDARELRELDRRLNAFSRHGPRVGVAAVQPGSGATTVTRLILRAHSNRTPAAAAAVEDFGAGRLNLDGLDALCVVTLADAATLPAALEFMAKLRSDDESAFAGRMILMLNHPRPRVTGLRTQLKLSAAVWQLRAAAFDVLSLAHDPALALGLTEHVRWDPRTRLAALRLGAAVLDAARSHAQ